MAPRRSAIIREPQVRALALAALAGVLLLLAGCTAGGGGGGPADADNNQRTGFYGGVSGGLTRP